MRRRKPYKDLYVYLLSGVLNKHDEGILGDAFLGNWVEGENSFLFFSRASLDIVSGLLRLRPGLELVEDHHFTYEQWQGGWLDTIRIGKFLIVPPWVKRGADEGVIKILLDPGVVFGNCLHPTTRDCLKALSLVAANDQFDRVLDLGAGTGVLAIAAALLGAKNVLAVDLNPLCVKTARENVRLNDLEGRVQVVQGSAEDVLSEHADLVVANIHYKVIKGLLEQPSFCEKKRLILSGLMRSQYRDIRVGLERGNFMIIREWDHEMPWFTILAGTA